MHFERFELENLGPIRRVELPLDPGFNVLAGINGAGKTTVLNAIAVMLGRYSSAVRTGRAAGSFNRDQIRREARSVRAVASARMSRREDAPIFSWSAGLSRPGRGTVRITRSNELIEQAAVVAEAIERQSSRAGLPFGVLYSVNRAVLDVPLRTRRNVPFDHYTALDDALSQGARNFRTFFAWFRDREDVENEARAEGSRRRDRQLAAVRAAVAGMLPGFEGLRVRRQPLRMLITKDGVDLRIDELSDGEKCMLAMAGDLARRLAIANPGLPDPLEGSAIVLIDEVELHLHPRWQREAVSRLRDTFRNCQFIVTTHSPQVLSEVAPEATFLLQDGRVVRPLRSLGRDSNLILEELMGTTSRPAWAEEELTALYQLIDDEDLDRARARLRQLEERLGTEDPGLTAARAVLSSSVPAG